MKRILGKTKAKVFKLSVKGLRPKDIAKELNIPIDQIYYIRHYYKDRIKLWATPDKNRFIATAIVSKEPYCQDIKLPNRTWKQYFMGLFR